MKKTNVTKLEFYENEAGEWRWRAKAKNGEIVATGEAHTRKTDAKRAATAVFPGIKITKAKEEKVDGEASGEAEVQAIRPAV